MDHWSAGVFIGEHPRLRAQRREIRMSAELVSILVLAVVFVIATTRSINMGALAFAAAFGVGTLAAGMDADAIFAGFPGDLFVVLVGVTYLFAIARANGTTDWLVHASIRLVGGRLALIPWVMFGVTGVLTAIGAVSPAAVAIVAPIALNFARKYGISPLLMGAMVVHGGQAGGFSPISIYGTIVNGIVAREGLPGNEIVLFLASVIVNLAIAAIVFVVCGGLKLSRSADRALAMAGAATHAAETAETAETGTLATAPRTPTPAPRRCGSPRPGSPRSSAWSPWSPAHWSRNSTSAFPRSLSPCCCRSCGRRRAGRPSSTSPGRRCC
nr:SLC13 family permease [Saccharomonospora sp. CUA-673]